MKFGIKNLTLFFSKLKFTLIFSDQNIFREFSGHEKFWGSGKNFYKNKKSIKKIKF
jgi:hypothetical protein